GTPPGGRRRPRQDVRPGRARARRGGRGVDVDPRGPGRAVRVARQRRPPPRRRVPGARRSGAQRGPRRRGRVAARVGRGRAAARRAGAARLMESRTDPLRAGILIGVTVGLVGITFGVLARSAGLSVAKACTMSLLVFTGASQFAAVGVVGSGGSALAALGAAVLLAARNTLYGPVVGRAVRGPLWSRLVQSQLVIDESAGLAAAQPDARSARRGFLAAGLGVFAFW